jgi:hypothetical protein
VATRPYVNDRPAGKRWMVIDPAIYRIPNSKTEHPVQAFRSIRETSIYVNKLYKESIHLPKMLKQSIVGVHIRGGIRVDPVCENSILTGGHDQIVNCRQRRPH